MSISKTSHELRELYTTLRMFEEFYEEVEGTSPQSPKLEEICARIIELKHEIRSFYVGNEYDPEIVLIPDYNGGIEKYNLGIPALFSKGDAIAYVIEQIIYPASNDTCNIPGTPYTCRVKLVVLHGMWYCYHYVGIIGY